ncbi:MAG TPA: tetratricopeptide repeat protein, partial [Schlesneria sp.]
MLPQPALKFLAEGVAAQEADQLDRAIENFTEAIRLDPKLVIAYDFRALASVAKGDFKAAIRDTSKAIELDPKSKQSHVTRGKVYISMGDYEDAIKD